MFTLWQYGLWSFQTWGTKLERFLPKNQNTQRELFNELFNEVNNCIDLEGRLFEDLNYL